MAVTQCNATQPNPTKSKSGNGESSGQYVLCSLFDPQPSRSSHTLLSAEEATNPNRISLYCNALQHIVSYCCLLTGCDTGISPGGAPVQNTMEYDTIRWNTIKASGRDLVQPMRRFCIPCLDTKVGHKYYFVQSEWHCEYELHLPPV